MPFDKSQILVWIPCMHVSHASPMQTTLDMIMKWGEGHCNFTAVHWDIITRCTLQWALLVKYISHSNRWPMWNEIQPYWWGNTIIWKKTKKITINKHKEDYKTKKCDSNNNFPQTFNIPQTVLISNWVTNKAPSSTSWITLSLEAQGKMSSPI